MITGGASGIGEAVARRVVAGGGYAGIADQDETRAKVLLAELGDRAAFAPCDASSEASVAAALDALSGHLPPINALFASAAIRIRSKSAAALSVEEFRAMVDSHLTWTYVANRVVGLRLVAGGGGAIVNMASVLAFRPGPVMGYSEGKVAVMNLTQSLAVEWAMAGVRVNAVAPGWTDTPYLDARRVQGFGVITDAVPQHRMIAPAEIAEVVHFLLSPAASAISGATIPCDAGYIAGTGWAPHGGIPKA
jgi:NAD(P)-dependent dehydrogenase (short-subunit alcohol dehydrogenase family)